MQLIPAKALNLAKVEFIPLKAGNLRKVDLLDKESAVSYFPWTNQGMEMFFSK